MTDKITLSIDSKLCKLERVFTVDYHSTDEGDGFNSIRSTETEIFRVYTDKNGKWREVSKALNRLQNWIEIRHKNNSTTNRWLNLWTEITEKIR